MPSEQATIPTPDGDCPVRVLKPAGAGPFPAVIFYMDAGGIRPAMIAMAQRLADAGHVVLLPDLFWRFGPYGPLVPEEVFRGDVMAVLGPLIATTGNAKAAADTGAFLGWLDQRTDIAGRKVGAVGFCMGGGMAIAAAGTHPGRFAAAASFHGGNMATDAPDSPHRFAPKIEAELYIASADKDESYPPAMAERFEGALAAARVRYRAEAYAGAAHGWMVPDFPVHDPAAAELGWARLLALLKRSLQPG